MTDETEDEKPKADPLAHARAIKAQKAADKAAAEAQAAELASRPSADNQPKRSKRRGARLLEDAKGPTIMVRVLSGGRDHISTGGDFGFERYDMWAEIPVEVGKAFDLWKKGYIEPMEREDVVRFDKMKTVELRREAQAKRKFDDVMERGVALGEDYRSDPYGPPSASL
jgi:hypothetical protein